MRHVSLSLLLTAGVAAAPHSLAQSCEERLLADNGAPFDFLGRAVAIEGDRLFGAAPETPTGNVYVYERAGGAWTQVQKLQAIGGQIDDLFGSWVDLDGDLLAVGAPGDDDFGASSGSAYVFARVGGAWQQAAKLLPSVGAAGDRFGNAQVSGATVLVGAPNTASGGAVFVFEDPGGGWAEQQTFAASDGAPGHRFGWDLDVDGDRAVIGAPFHPGGGAGEGAAYVFERVAGVWTEVALLTISDGQPGDRVGDAVTVEGDVVLVGADRSDTAGADAGAAYVFERSGGVWTETAKLVAPDGAGGDLFGIDLDLEGATAVVGASRHDDFASSLGAAYVFEKVGGEWTFVTDLSPFTVQNFLYFGSTVALDGGRVVCGATGANANGSGSGALFVRELFAPLGTTYCSPAVPNSTGAPGFLAAAGCDVVDRDHALLFADSLPANQTGYFLTSPQQGFVANPGGSQGDLCLGGAIGRYAGLAASSGAAGRLALDLDLAAVPTPSGDVAVQPGETWNFQCWYRDQNPGSTSNFTDAASVLFQ